MPPDTPRISATAAPAHAPLTGLDGLDRLHGLDALVRACAKGEVQVVQGLLHAGIDPKGTRSDGASPMFAAVMAGHGEVIDCLIKAGASVRDAMANHTGWSLQAVEWSDFGPQAIRAVGRSPGFNWDDERNPGGRTALSIVAQSPAQHMVERARALMDAGANPNEPDRAGMTPVMLAAFCGSPEMVVELAARGDLTVRSKSVSGRSEDDGATAVHITVIGKESGQLERLAALIAAGADPEAVDERGRTARDWAVSAALPEVTAWLDARRAHQAVVSAVSRAKSSTSLR